MARPSPKQAKFLRERNLSVPTTQAGAHAMINFIIKGNGSDGGITDSDGRAVLLLKEQERLRGKTVDVRGDKNWRVRYVLPRSAAEIRDHRQEFKEDGVVYPFKVCLEPITGKNKPIIVGLHQIKVIE